MKKNRSEARAIADPTGGCGCGFLATALLSALILLSACGPDRNLALEAAKREYEVTRADPAVAAHAGTELSQAQHALDQGEQAVADGEHQDAEHYAEVAETDLRTAREVARAGTAGVEKKTVEKELAALQARETERGIVLTLSDVFFEVDSAKLKPEGMQNLAQLAAFLNDHPDRALAIEGHTDSTGTDGYNQQLSERRAAPVQSFLVASGVSPSRVAAQGFGKRFPVASNGTASGRAMNRRVEMLVLNPGQPVRVSSVPLVRSYETTTTRTTTY
jgi:outer membrane protein OmpA-like peptidoglycan-associated protein